MPLPVQLVVTKEEIARNVDSSTLLIYDESDFRFLDMLELPNKQAKMSVGLSATTFKDVESCEARHLKAVGI